MCFSIGAAITAASISSTGSNAGSRYASTGEIHSRMNASSVFTAAWIAISRLTRSVTTKGFFAFSRLARTTSSSAIRASSNKASPDSPLTTSAATPAAAIATDGRNARAELRFTLFT